MTTDDFRKLAEQDAQYKLLLEQLKVAEANLDKAELTMEVSERDAVWDFFDALEDINLRMLEIALVMRDALLSGEIP